MFAKNIIAVISWIQFSFVSLYKSPDSMRKTPKCMLKDKLKFFSIEIHPASLTYYIKK